MPKLFESYETVGTLKPELAEELGIPETCKIVAGAGDNAAAAVGTGTVGDGMCNISWGPAEPSLFPAKNSGRSPQCPSCFCARRRPLSPDGLYVKRSFL